MGRERDGGTGGFRSDTGRILLTADTIIFMPSGPRPTRDSSLSFLVFALCFARSFATDHFLYTATMALRSAAATLLRRTALAAAPQVRLPIVFNLCFWWRRMAVVGER
jgi:hypothetical protein